eukprot:IDg5487t1
MKQLCDEVKLHCAGLKFPYGTIVWLCCMSGFLGTWFFVSIAYRCPDIRLAWAEGHRTEVVRATILDFRAIELTANGFVAERRRVIRLE